MSAHRAKLSSAILFLLSVSLLTTACANDPTGPSISSPTAADTPRPNIDPHTISRSRVGLRTPGEPGTHQWRARQAWRQALVQRSGPRRDSRGFHGLASRSL